MPSLKTSRYSFQQVYLSRRIHRCLEIMDLTAKSTDLTLLHFRRFLPRWWFSLLSMCLVVWYGFPLGFRFARLLLNALGAERVGPPGQRNLHPLCLIEQISDEQLLPVKMTLSHFITADKRSVSICMLQLSAIARNCPLLLSMYHDKHNYLNISFYGFDKSTDARSMPSVHQLQPRPGS